MCFIEATSWYESSVLWAAMAAIATIAYTVFSILLWRTTRDAVKLTRESVDIARRSIKISKRAFEAASRPYVYIEESTLGGSLNRELININAKFKNCGNFLATEVIVTFKIYKRNSQEVIQERTEPTFLLEPGKSKNTGISIAGSNYGPIRSGEIPIDVKVDVRYKGITQVEYYYRERYQWNTDATSIKFEHEAN